MDTNWLEDFVSFARNLNFTKAANERHVSQSAFSRRIQSLEAWMGAELIDRKTSPATLSPAGEAFLPLAKELMQSLLKGRDDILTKVGRESSTLRFAAPHSISLHHLAKLLSDLSELVPDLKTRVTSDNLHHCCDHLSAQSCDFLMCYRFPGVRMTLEEGRFESVDVGTDKLVPVVSSESKLQDQQPLPGSPEQPAPYLQYSSGSFLGAVMEQLFSTMTPNLVVRHTDAFAESLKTLCLQGAGIAWLPEASIKNELARKELVRIGNEDWQIELKLAIFTEPALHNKQNHKAWQYFKELEHFVA